MNYQKKLNKLFHLKLYKNNKIPETNLTKDIKGFNFEKHNTLMKEKKGDKRNEKIPFSWIGRIF